MFERFTERARRVVVLAQEESRMLKHNYIGTEHLLLGLIAEQESVAAWALGSLRITQQRVRDQVQEIIGEGTTGEPTPHIPFTPRTKKVLELSLKEAQELGPGRIGPEHILLGLIREGEGVAAQILGRLGVSLAQVRDRVVEALSHGPAQRIELHEQPVFGVGGAAESVGPRPESMVLCPSCSSLLAAHARTRLVLFGADEGAPRELIVAYCGACGAAIGIVPD